MQILVTGGAGFIGSHLVNKLIQMKEKVIAIDNLTTGKKENIKHQAPNCIFIKGDITDKKFYE
ncbi:MAG: NAD-dependent epimerase/dehydratase family protein, partial [Candidatus Nanoarchaeia archaeon]|nr:NAD-dependent epimerase/dehydratase family protein [Candidatus Jingweiarchaeum tengchongense]